MANNIRQNTKILIKKATYITINKHMTY